MSKNISLFNTINTGEALKSAVKNTPEEVIQEIIDSGLRGRGGAGFPAGLKWKFTRQASGEKVLICNADEGEVGTFKDRELLLNCPLTLCEGLAIAAYAIDAKKAFIYLRAEYTYLKDKLQQAIDQFKAHSTIEIHIHMGAGAYVCGDETALIESMEGLRGEPRFKPPFPVEKGFFGQPTSVNNVETLCCIPHIVLNGAKAFASIGTEQSTGPKLFSVSGDVDKPGVYEAPMGTTLEEVLKKAEAKDTKAVLCGGASGLCVGRADLKRKLAFEDLPPGGAIIVMNSSRSMIDVMANLMSFFEEESCGQCVPCREGTKQLLRFINKLKTEKVIDQADIDHCLELAETMNISSKCGLGQSAVNAFLSILNTFEKEVLNQKESVNEK